MARVAGPKVGVDALRVGMFIHLDLGWWAHPFALSSFAITSNEQIEQIRRLGLTAVRVCPERSVKPAAPDADVERDASSTSFEDSVTAFEPSTTATTSPVATPAQLAAAAIDRAATPAAAPAPSASDDELDARAHAQCAQQVREAQDAWLEASRALPHDPLRAGTIARGLTDALLAKLLIDGELSVRALAAEAGDAQAAHAMNVTVVAMLLGRVAGLERDEMHALGVGAMLHDVGKLALPVAAQYDDERASAADRARYQEHVAHGVAIGRRMALDAAALAVIAQHHEAEDASGFPLKVRGERMSTASRIVALVDAYDRLCHPRPPSPGMTPHEALSHLFTVLRARFDAPLLNAFIRMMGVYPPGSVVHLTDERYATVVSVNSSRPLKPDVRVFDSDGARGGRTRLLRLDACASLGIRRSVRAAQLPQAVREHLAPASRMVYFFEPVHQAAAVADAQPA